MANNKQSWLDGPNIPGENDDPSAPGRWPTSTSSFSNWPT